MTAFDLFQQATVQISQGDRLGAAKSLQRAIARIDKDGVDRELLPDLYNLCRQLMTANVEG